MPSRPPHATPAHEPIVRCIVPFFFSTLLFSNLGGNPDDFKAINEAYDVLRDPEKRRIYDEYGEDAVKEAAAGGGGPPGGMADIFEMFAGGGRARGPRRGENVVHRLKVTLEDLYRGATRKMSLQRNVKCAGCSGAGTTSGRRYPCDACHGSGVQVSMRPLGPGMMQQIQHPCAACGQTGFAIPPSDRCASCSGRGLTPEKKVFEVHIDRGHRHGSRIVLRGEAGCSDPSVQPGDVVFVLEQAPHARFKRIGADLVMAKTVTLAEALTGVAFTVDTLDEGRRIAVSHPPGAVVKPDAWVRVEHEGMPHHGRPIDKGNLYIHYTVEFPDALAPAQVDGLRKLLGGGPPPPAPTRAAAGSTSADAAGEGTADVMMIDGAEVVAPVPVPDIEAELQGRRAAARSAGGGAAESSDDEDERGGRVQCAQQ